MSFDLCVTTTCVGQFLRCTNDGDEYVVADEAKVRGCPVGLQFDEDNIMAPRIVARGDDGSFYDLPFSAVTSTGVGGHAIRCCSPMPFADISVAPMRQLDGSKRHIRGDDDSIVSELTLPNFRDFDEHAPSVVLPPSFSNATPAGQGQGAIHPTPTRLPLRVRSGGVIQPNSSINNSNTISQDPPTVYVYSRRKNSLPKARVLRPATRDDDSTAEPCRETIVSPVSGRCPTPRSLTPKSQFPLPNNNSSASSCNNVSNSSTFTRERSESKSALCSSRKKVLPKGFRNVGSVNHEDDVPEERYPEVTSVIVDMRERRELSQRSFRK